MPLFPNQLPPMGGGPPGMPAAMGPPPAIPPPFMGGSTQDMIGMMALKKAMEPSHKKMQRVIDQLDDIRKMDEKVAPIASMMIDLGRNGPDALTGGGTRQKTNTSPRPSTSMGL